MPDNTNSLIIRKAETLDIEFVKDIETECELSPWSLSDYKAELSRNNSIFMVVEKDLKLTGFLLARLITNMKTCSDRFLFEDKDKQSKNNKIYSEPDADHFEIELYNIGVRSAYRRSKIGYYLMMKLLEEANQYRADAITLEVRKSNTSAINFYKKFKFSEIYERKNLYTNPSENGLGMKLDLSI